MKADEYTPAVAIAQHEAMTPIFAGVAKDMGGYPVLAPPATVTKRDESRAWRLTKRVDAALTGDDPQHINGVTVYPIGYGEEVKA